MKVAAFFIAFSALVAVATSSCSGLDHFEDVRSCGKALRGLGYYVDFDENTDVTEPATRRKLCCGVRYTENCLKTRLAGTGCVGPTIAFVREGLRRESGFDYQRHCDEVLNCAA